jgi:hypothetical protein
MQYLQLFQSLHANQVMYLICGGVAVNIYGIPRMTIDIDILISFEAENVARLEKSLAALGYQPFAPVPVNWLCQGEQREKLIREKNMIAFSFYHQSAKYINLDVVLVCDSPFESLWCRKEVRKVEDFEVFIVSLEDLIHLKKQTGRPKDLADLAALGKLKNLNL